MASRLGMFQSDPGGRAPPSGCPASALAADFRPFSETYLADFPAARLGSAAK